MKKLQNSKFTAAQNTVLRRVEVAHKELFVSRLGVHIRTDFLQRKRKNPDLEDFDLDKAWNNLHSAACQFQRYIKRSFNMPDRIAKNTVLQKLERNVILRLEEMEYEVIWLQLSGTVHYE